MFYGGETHNPLKEKHDYNHYAYLLCTCWTCWTRWMPCWTSLEQKLLLNMDTIFNVISSRLITMNLSAIDSCYNPRNTHYLNWTSCYAHWKTCLAAPNGHVHLTQIQPQWFQNSSFCLTAIFVLPTTQLWLNYEKIMQYFHLKTGLHMLQVFPHYFQAIICWISLSWQSPKWKRTKLMSCICHHCFASTQRKPCQNSKTAAESTGCNALEMLYLCPAVSHAKTHMTVQHVTHSTLSKIYVLRVTPTHYVLRAGLQKLSIVAAHSVPDTCV